MTRKMIPLLITVLVLAGCAQFNPPYETTSESNALKAQLDYAYREAKTSLELAEDLRLAETPEKRLRRARNLLETTYEEQQDAPSYQQLRVYADVRELANESLVETLRSELENQRRLVETLETDLGQLDDRRREDLEKLRRKLENANRTMKSQQETIDSLKNRLDGANEKLVQLTSRLNDQASRIESLQAKLGENGHPDREDADQPQKKASTVGSDNSGEDEDLLSTLRGRLDRVALRREDGRVYLAFPAGDLFEQGRAVLSPAAQERLDTVAEVIKSVPDRPVRIYGHTGSAAPPDESPFETNWDLSSQRAINVLKFFAYARGVSTDRLGAVAFADRWPEKIDEPFWGEAGNARLEVVLLPETSPKGDPAEKLEQIGDDVDPLVRDKNLRFGPNRLHLNLTDKLQFASAKAELDTAARSLLDELGSILEKHPERPVIVQGHTDDLPLAEEARYESNWELSAARAISVVTYLDENFDMGNRRFGAGGMGQFHPLVPNTSSGNRDRNRRVEVIFLE